MSTSNDYKALIKGPRILVFIIAYNEESSIAAVIDDIKTHAPYADIVLIDDCSTDTTAKIARGKGVYVIKHILNSKTPGYAAVRTAMMYAFLNNYDICCQFDGDGQHDAAYLQKIIAPVAEGLADLVIGSRFIETAGYQQTLVRVTGIKVFSYITSWIINQRIKDISSGFKASGRKIIALYANFPYMLTDTNEMLILAKRTKHRILEVPVHMRERQHGKSWHSFFKFSIYPIRTMLYILSVLIKPQKV